MKIFVFQMPPKPRLSLIADNVLKVLLESGASTTDIVKILHQEGVVTCRQTVWRFKCHLENHHQIEPLPKCGRQTKLTKSVLKSIENSMQNDDEATAKAQTTCNAKISTTTALKGQRLLGWTTRGTAYCQFICAKSRAK